MQSSIIMRDRLSHLQAYSASSGYEESQQNSGAVSPSRMECDDKPQDHDSNPELEAVFKEAQDIRCNIEIMLLEVKHLKEQNSYVCTGLQHPGIVKSDSDAIAARIRTNAKDLLVCLRKMAEHEKELERRFGADAAISRIARTQYAQLSKSFHNAMIEYNKTEMSLQETCKLHIQKQIEIVGQELTGEQIEEMMERRQWNIFNENILTEGKTVRSALSQIESRHTELLELESRISSIHDIFLDVAVLVEEQDSMINYIQNNVQKTDAKMKCMLQKLDDAKRHSRNNPFKRIFFRKR